MGDVEMLLLVLVIVYATECLAWIPQGSIALVKAWRPKYLVRRPSSLPGNDRGSLYLAPVLPPLGTIFLVPGLPLCLSPQTMVAWPPSCPSPGGRPQLSGESLSWESIHSVRSQGHSLYINDQLFLKAGSSGQATTLAHHLHQLSQATPENRSKGIDQFLQDSFDLTLAQTRWDIFKKAQSKLRLPTNLLFLYLFVLGPILVFQYELSQVGFPLGAGLLFQSVLISLRFRKFHRELFPGAEEERFKYFFTMLLTPPAAIRATDYLSKHFFSSFHALTICKMILSPKDFAAMARRFLIDLEFPLLPPYPNQSPETMASVDWFREKLLTQARQFVSDAGLDPHEITSPHVPMEPETVAYCPRCHAQFITAQGSCYDCGGRTLESWPQPR